MPRLPYYDIRHAPTELADWLGRLPRTSIVDMLSHSVSTVRPFLEQASAFFTSLELPEREREFAILVVAAVIGGEYQQVQHDPIAHAAGVDPETRAILRQREFDSDRLSAADQLLAKFVEHVARGLRVSDELLALIREDFSDREIVELLQVIGFYWSACRLCDVLGVDIDHPDGLTSFRAVAGLGEE